MSRTEQKEVFGGRSKFKVPELCIDGQFNLCSSDEDCCGDETCNWYPPGYSDWDSCHASPNCWGGTPAGTPGSQQRCG